MSLFPFPMPKLPALDLAAKIRAPLNAIFTATNFINNTANFLGKLDRSFNNGNFDGMLSEFDAPDRHNFPKDFCFIRVLTDSKDNSKDTVIPFQFMPKTISDVKSAIYQDIQIIGRSSPFKSYSASSARTITFTLDFYTAPEQGSDQPTPRDIKGTIMSLQALLYPNYKDYSIAPPPKCIVHIGDQVNMLGICKTVSVSYNAQQIPWTSIRQSGAYHMFGASVALSFEEVKTIPIGYLEKYEGADEEPKATKTISDSSNQEESQATPPPDVVTSETLAFAADDYTPQPELF